MLQSPHKPRPATAAATDRPTTVAIRPSILRLGLPVRLAGAGLLLLGIWSLIGWTL